MRRDYRRGRGRRAAALVGILLGFGLLAAIAWAFAGNDERAVAPETATGATDTAPPKPVLRIVFPEGFTRKEMAARVREVNRIAENRRNIEPALRPGEYTEAAERVRDLPEDFRRVEAPHLEGFLFPATYEFNPDTTSRQLVAQQLEAFDRAWEQVDMRYARSKRLTPYDVVIIASMVEKEVQVPRERALVSAVIYNRLRAGMPLGIDATIRYGLD
ncbi:MAG: endolytic transglycosylase MltG, partial [Gaiellaceae bacterium]